MTDERKDEAPAASGEERPKRAGPTIDLEASDVSGDTRMRSGLRAVRAFLASVAATLAGAAAWAGAHLTAPLVGAVAALLVVAALWAGGLVAPPKQPQPAQFDNVAANVGELTARLSRLEATAARPVAPAGDPALTGRIEALEKSLATARDDVARLSTQARALAASVNELKASPRDGAAAAPDLGPLTERLTQLEDATRRLSAELGRAQAPSADDISVRRLAIATTLEAAVRRGEPYASALAAAKQVAPNPATLAPLDAFAASGLPSETAALREIVTILQRIAASAAARRSEPPASEKPAGTVIERLQAGLAKLVRVERTDAPSDATPASAAGDLAVRRDSVAAARQDVAKLPQASDPQIQAWLKSVDARDAALNAARKFSAEALAALAKSGQ